MSASMGAVPRPTALLKHPSHANGGRARCAEHLQPAQSQGESRADVVHVHRVMHSAEAVAPNEPVDVERRDLMPRYGAGYARLQEAVENGTGSVAHIRCEQHSPLS